MCHCRIRFSSSDEGSSPNFCSDLEQNGFLLPAAGLKAVLAGVGPKGCAVGVPWDQQLPVLRSLTESPPAASGRYSGRIKSMSNQGENKLPAMLGLFLSLALPRDPGQKQGL